VVDLRTGALMPHDPALLITKVTSGRYRPGFRHPDWQKALEALPPMRLSGIKSGLARPSPGIPHQTA
jgi:hypothetical protein